MGKRIQRLRTKNWKMPKNAVYVGRPTKYGNPYKMVTEEDRIRVLIEYELWLRRKLLEDNSFLDELIGKDLVCWCPLDKPCHADILLRYIEKRVLILGTSYPLS